MKPKNGRKEMAKEISCLFQKKKHILPSSDVNVSGYYSEDFHRSLRKVTLITM